MYRHSWLLRMILLLSAATLINIILALVGCAKFTQQFGLKKSMLMPDSQSIELWNRYKSPVSADSLMGFASKSLLSDNKNVGTLLGSFQVREREVGWPIRFIRGAGVYPDMLQGKDQIQLHEAVLPGSIDYQLLPYNVRWFRLLLNITIHSLRSGVVAQ